MDVLAAAVHETASHGTASGAVVLPREAVWRCNVSGAVSADDDG